LAVSLISQGRLDEAEAWLVSAERTLRAKAAPATGLSVRQARGVLEGFGRQTSMAARLAIGFVFQLFIQTPFAAVGGLLGVAMFGEAQQAQHQ
jgi:hypothetical protein